MNSSPPIRDYPGFLGLILALLLGLTLGCWRATEPPPPDPDAVKKELEKLQEQRKKEWGQ